MKVAKHCVVLRLISPHLTSLLASLDGHDTVYHSLFLFFPDCPTLSVYPSFLVLSSPPLPSSLCLNHSILPPPFSLHSTPSISSPLLSSPLFSFLFPSPHPSGSSVGMTRKETSGNGGDNFDVYSSRDREREREKAGAEESYPIARGLVRK